MLAPAAGGAASSRTTVEPTTTNRVPEPGDGEVLLRTDWLGIDATVRTWLSKAEGYIPPVEIGEVVRCERHRPGDVVAQREGPRGRARRRRLAGLAGATRSSATTRCSRPRSAEGADPLADAQRLRRRTALTAYVGLTDIGKVQRGRDRGRVRRGRRHRLDRACRSPRSSAAASIGIAGTDEKCAWLVDDLGLDGAINHRTDDIPARLKELCPKRRRRVLRQHRRPDPRRRSRPHRHQRPRRARAAPISSYNEARKPPGPANYLNLISRRARMQGVHLMGLRGGGGPRSPRGSASWVDRGQAAAPRRTIFEGLASAAAGASTPMFTGENVGMIVVARPRAETACGPQPELGDQRLRPCGDGSWQA